MLLVIPVSSEVKASVLNRVIAKWLDIVIIFSFGVFITYPLGPLLGFFYSLCADGMHFGPFEGQSVGKKVMGLQTLNRIKKRPASVRDSILRNAPVGAATFFAIIPLWGWLILGLIGIPLMVMEIYLMIRVESGHRLGDVMGDTEVIEVKKPSK